MAPLVRSIRSATIRRRQDQASVGGATGPSGTLQARTANRSDASRLVCSALVSKQQRDFGRLSRSPNLERLAARSARPLSSARHATSRRAIALATKRSPGSGRLSAAADDRVRPLPSLREPATSDGLDFCIRHPVGLSVAPGLRRTRNSQLAESRAPQGACRMGSLPTQSLVVCAGLRRFSS